jgi:F0F1-type ATP synthase membrane subunit b/b'
MTEAYDTLTGRKEREQAKRTARQAEESIGRQKQLENARLAEESADLAEAKARGLSGRSGRRSLVKTSNRGLVSNLGGATNQ